jgi:SAM-dependent methyltransferase
MVWTLHHVVDLDVALDKVVELLRPAGILVLDEFGHERLDAPTAEWFRGQSRAHASPADFLREWEDEHVGLHGYGAMRPALDARFEERTFSWEPYLYRLLRDAVSAESLERALIDAGAIRALGFRYVGVPR